MDRRRHSHQRACQPGWQQAPKHLRVSVYINDDGGPYKYRHAEAVVLDCDAIVSIPFNAGGAPGSNRFVRYNAAEYSQIWQFQIHPTSSTEWD